MRSALVCSMGMFAAVTACVSTPEGGTLGEGAAVFPKIVSVDTAFPPRSVMVQLNQPAYAAVLLVAVGHSATLLYPSDSTTNNQLSAASHSLRIEIPSLLAQSDSERIARARDSMRVRTPRSRTGTRTRTATPLPPNAVVYLLLLTSPQPLVYQRIIDKTGGVSIPNIDNEALNAIAKAVKSTLTAEPREWAGHYLPIELRRSR